MKKKILSSALALMVVLETATTAFAAGDGTYSVTDYTASEVETEMNNNNGVVSTEVTIKGGDNGKSGFAVILPKTNVPPLAIPPRRNFIFVTDDLLGGAEIAFGQRTKSAPLFATVCP